jgi:tRNA threonylcarbamoyl adenosine modification protein YeaZ
MVQLIGTLALETSTDVGSVAVLDDADRVIGSRSWQREKSHSEFLTAALLACLTDAQLQPSELSQIAVDVGPGSFTGIRVAVNAARTLGFSLNKPLHVFNSLEVIAYGAQEVASQLALPILVLLSAQKNRLYMSQFELSSQQLVTLQGPSVVSFENVSTLLGQRPWLCVGPGYDEGFSSWNDKTCAQLHRSDKVSDTPSAINLAKMSVRRGEHDKMFWPQVQPLYLRPSEPEEKLRAGLLIDRSKLNE